MKLLLTINRKLFHHSPAHPVGGVIAAVDLMAPQRPRIHLNWTERSGARDMTRPRLNQVVRLHVREYLRDPHYTIFWNDNTGIETQVNELP